MMRKLKFGGIPSLFAHVGSAHWIHADWIHARRIRALASAGPLGRFDIRKAADDHECAVQYFKRAKRAGRG